MGEIKNSIKICEGLSISQGNDGHWLSFSSSKGKYASLCLKNQRGIAGKAMLEWGKEFWKNENPHCGTASKKR